MHGGLDVDWVSDFAGSESQTAPHFPPGIGFVNSFSSVDMLSAVWLRLNFSLFPGIHMKESDCRFAFGKYKYLKCP